MKAGYAYLKVNDSYNCADHFYGIGEFQELKIILAKRHTFGLRKGWRWSPFVQAGIYTSYSTYSGDFSGEGTSFNIRNIKFRYPCRSRFAVRTFRLLALIPPGKHPLWILS
ncbi:MAG: hypothetical protein KL787_01360 [Taibaiella sp.]|nr:hypothetical protein [Taibaiella sp.]